MDPRIRQHADVVADWSMAVKPGDKVIVEFEDGGKPLADALVGAIAKRGAQPIQVMRSAVASRQFLLNATQDALKAEPAHLRALTEAADVFIFIEAGENTRELADVPAVAQQARARAMNAIREVRLSKRWCLTIHPTPALAQEAGMATEAFADLVYRAVLIDWRAFAQQVERVKERVSGSKEVHLVASDTDLFLPVRDRAWVASTGHSNMPSGEVFTAPHEHAVEGHVHLDLPAVVLGQEVQGLKLKFEKGLIVDWDAARGREAVRALLMTDDGAQRLGELGIGMNRGIDRPTKNILLDEKMGGTIHLAVGRAYKENKGVNESAVHQDFIKTMGPGSYVSVDGEVVQRNGHFWFEKQFNQPGR